MNIQITNIPQGQKIKSIDFKIEFDDCGGISETSSITSKTHTIVHQTPIQHTNNDASVNNVSIPEIDITKRKPKIDSSMVEETF